MEGCDRASTATDRPAMLELARRRIGNPDVVRSDRRTTAVAATTGVLLLAGCVALYAAYHGWLLLVLGGVYGLLALTLVAYEVAQTLWIDGYTTATNEQHGTGPTP